MNTPVSFELAKMLKEKAFNKKVFNYFDIYYELPTDVYSLGSFENWNVKSNLISAPTIAEVVMWLYEKRGIWIEVRFLQSFKTFYFELTNVNNLKGMTSKGENHYNSPTEAYESAIEYTLKNLI